MHTSSCATHTVYPHTHTVHTDALCPYTHTCMHILTPAYTVCTHNFFSYITLLALVMSIGVHSQLLIRFLCYPLTCVPNSPVNVMLVVFILDILRTLLGNENALSVGTSTVESADYIMCINLY